MLSAFVLDVYNFTSSCSCIYLDFYIGSTVIHRENERFGSKVRRNVRTAQRASEQSQ